MNKIFFETFEYLLEFSVEHITNKIVGYYDQIKHMEEVLKDPIRRKGFEKEYANKIKILRDSIPNLKSKLKNMGISNPDAHIDNILNKSKAAEQAKKAARDAYSKSTYTRGYDYSSPWAKYERAKKIDSIIIISYLLFASVTIILSLVMQYFKLKHEEAKRICSRIKDLNQRNECIRNYKKKMYDQVLQKLNNEKLKCKNTKNPSQCIKKIDEIINRLKQKMR